MDKAVGQIPNNVSANLIASFIQRIGDSLDLYESYNYSPNFYFPLRKSYKEKSNFTRLPESPEVQQ